MNQLEDEPRIVVQLASIDQSAIIAELLQEAFVEYKPLYTTKAFATTVPTPEQIQDRWTEGPVWIARFGEIALGTVAAIPKDAGLYIRSMAVRPEARGRGVGRLLLEQVENFAYLQGFNRLFLSTTPFLDRAIRLYEQLGFVRIEDGPSELFGTPLFTMEKVLNPATGSSR